MTLLAKSYNVIGSTTLLYCWQVIKLLALPHLHFYVIAIFYLIGHYNIIGCYTQPPLSLK